MYVTIKESFFPTGYRLEVKEIKSFNNAVLEITATSSKDVVTVNKTLKAETTIFLKTIAESTLQENTVYYIKVVIRDMANNIYDECTGELCTKNDILDYESANISEHSLSVVASPRHSLIGTSTEWNCCIYKGQSVQEITAVKIQSQGKLNISFNDLEPDTMYVIECEATRDGKNCGIARTILRTSPLEYVLDFVLGSVEYVSDTQVKVTGLAEVTGSLDVPIPYTLHSIDGMGRDKEVATGTITPSAHNVIEQTLLCEPDTQSKYYIQVDNAHESIKSDKSFLIKGSPLNDVLSAYEWNQYVQRLKKFKAIEASTLNVYRSAVADYPLFTPKAGMKASEFNVIAGATNHIAEVKSLSNRIPSVTALSPFLQTFIDNMKIIISEV